MVSTIGIVEEQQTVSKLLRLLRLCDVLTRPTKLPLHAPLAGCVLPTVVFRVANVPSN